MMASRKIEIESENYNGESGGMARQRRRISGIEESINNGNCRKWQWRS
jgi:hypothetical protein